MQNVLLKIEKKNTQLKKTFKNYNVKKQDLAELSPIQNVLLKLELEINGEINTAQIAKILQFQILYVRRK